MFQKQIVTEQQQPGITAEPFRLRFGEERDAMPIEVFLGTKDVQHLVAVGVGKRVGNIPASRSVKGLRMPEQ